MQAVKFSYNSDTRKLSVSGRDQVIVSGDSNSTKFIFNIPSRLDAYDLYIVFGDFYVETIDGEPTVPLYYINREDDTFSVPSDITSPNAGKEIYFQLVFYEAQGQDGNRTIIETSKEFPIYVSKSASKVKYYEYSDVLTKLSSNAYVASAYDIDQDEDRPVITFTTLQGSTSSLILDVPYLDENGKILSHFIPDGLVTLHDVSNYEQLEATSAKACDLAIITEGTGVKGDYLGDIYLYTNDNLWVPIYSQFDSIKLDGIEDGAQVNVIESVSLNGDVQQISDKTVILDLSDYVTRGEYSQALKYRGSVDYYADLPADAEQGDVYNIRNADVEHGIKAGDNVAWTGEEWDVLQGTVDLTGYYTKDETNELLDDKVDKIEGMGLSQENYTTEEKTKLSSIESGAQQNVLEQVKVNGEQLQITDKQVNIDLTPYALNEDLQQAEERISQNKQNIVTLEQNKVDKVDGKSLVSDTEIQKLETVSEGAQQNILEQVKVNGDALQITDKQVDIDLTPYALSQNLEQAEARITVNEGNITQLEQNKVDKVDGKSLVLDTEIQKLQTVSEGAQENTIETIQVNGVALTPDTDKSVNIDLSNYVEKEWGKSLSTNDFTDQLKTKLEEIEPGAQVNIIEAININDTPLTISDKTVTITPDTTPIEGGTNVIASGAVYTLKAQAESNTARIDQIETEIEDLTPYTMAIRQWDQEATYALDSTVIYNSKIYISVYDGENIGHEPTDDAYWTVIEGGSGGSSSAISRVIGDGINTSYNITHGFGTYDFFYSIRYNDTQNMAYVDATVEAVTQNIARITFAEAPESNSIRVILSPGAQGSTIIWGDTGIRYVQETPQNIWTITNTLGRLAVVQTMDDTGKFVEGVVTQTLDNSGDTYTVTIYFNEEVQGTAILI